MEVLARAETMQTLACGLTTSFLKKALAYQSQDQPSPPENGHHRSCFL
jgi:hypothetical protein